MRWSLIICILFASFGCSQLKYKYSFSKRYLASLTDDSVEVARIEAELKEKKIFASGIDSTFLQVKLFDQDGELLTSVDPADLTLSTSEDIEAMPFVLKQGIYKSQILPRVKSKSIKMRVDWMEAVSSSEIELVTTIRPIKDELKPNFNDYIEGKHHGDIYINRGSGFSETGTEGFNLTNSGENAIVTSEAHPSASRTFSFEYLEQARQNISLEVDDHPNDIVSHSMHSLFMFFPRKNLPLVEQTIDQIKVTLPNGEKLVFNKESKEIVDGIFSEGPIDIGSDRFKRHYADLKYRGKGVLLRANARGQSPQLGQFEALKIDQEFGLKGSVDVLIIHGASGKRCLRPKADFWEPIDVSPIEFKFATDEKFDLYLKANCGFGLSDS